ncbi:ent-kaurene oxidase [Westerdykella ornata]|uniref:Ent-kaurene oxidase n=1 Tax=Westerdykella ornata TaxID=318751 RepID=A0A6A6J9U5_WESOR|nr:ent-kaurene oxidase [Westerdykella ornata]KAF2272943.1 ent-kaurene oxidase [Westerdykella ornata]
MELQSLTGAAHTLQTFGIASVVFVLLWFLPRIRLEARLRKLPAYVYEDSGKKTATTYMTSAKRIYIAGYNKFKNHVFRISTNESIDTVVVPVKFLPELRKLPDSVLSFPEAVADLLHTKYTKISTDEPISAHVAKADLTPALARLNPIIDEEVEQAMAEEMPPCEDWTEVYIYMKLVNAVAKVSGRVFVGPELCRNKEYLDAAANYTLDLISAQRKISEIKPWQRPFLAPRLKEVKQLRIREEKAKEILEPVVNARREAEKNDPTYKKPDDMLQWLMNRGSDYGRDSIESLAKVQLGLIFAAIHTTTLTATNILYTMAERTEYIQPIREEIRQAMADNDGVMTYRALQQMEKLDSFMKETMRFYPPGFTSFNRKVLRGFTLSNGQYIPAGVTIEVPSHAVYQDSSNYPDGDVFDGYRFYKLRQQGGAQNHARNQFVTTNETNLAFGYGRHACPGRFFASNEIKMMLARTLLEYDFKLPEGVTERYPNQEFGRSTSPDAAKPLLFKKVKA